MKKILIFLLFTSFALSAQEGRRLEVLFLGDNGHHKPIDRVPVLMEAFGPKGINFTYTDDLGDLNAKYLTHFDAIMIYANWDEINPSAEKALLDYVASGHGVLPIHCASYCFRNSDEYVKMVGGQFWRHTMDSITTKTVQPAHPIMKGLSPFTAFDETYLHSKLQDDNNILAVRDIKADQVNDKPGVKTEPYTWTRSYGKGKVFYTAYGHDERTWEKKEFQDLLYNALLWSVNDEALAAFNARNAKPFEYKEAKLPNYEQRPGTQYQQLALTPEESMKHIQVPVGFDLSLYAAEPNVMHPIALSWDEKGRLFVLITKDYPNERKPEGGSDYILICEDTDKDGKADKFTRFAEGLSIPTGMVFANGGLIVSQAPDILFLKDTNGDDKADVKETLYTGFGTFDTHAGPSNLHYGFDNWIWGCVGYSGFQGQFGDADSLKFGQAFFRFKTDGSDLQWMTTTSNNTWGFDFNENNDVFGSTANNSHGWYMPIPKEYFNSKGRVDNGSRSTDTHRDMKPITPKVRQVDAFGGFTAAAGHNFYSARSFPEKYWNKIAFVSEPTGHILHQNNLVKNGTDFSDKEAFNLMAGADEWFSPVFAQVGPDGAVWVADWYSFIIQHNPRPDGFEMGEGNAYETDLRDFTHGRIYRVGYKEGKPSQQFKLSSSDTEGLLNALKSDNMLWRMHAQRMLVERGNKDVVRSLMLLLANRIDDEIGLNPTAIHALWTLKGLGALDKKAIEIGLSHPNAEVRKNTIKAMDFSKASVDLLLKYNLLNDEEPLVVLNSLLLLSKSPIDANAEAAFFARLEKSKETNDRWLPDAFACVLTANDGALMKKHLARQASNAKAEAPVMDHSQHQMGSMDKMSMAQKKSKGIDLVVSKIVVEPANPAVRERVEVGIQVTNQGEKDVPVGVFIPLDVRFEGMGVRNDQYSRNYSDGIKSGETVTIKENLNGPWRGRLAFSSDIAGDYQISAKIDNANEIAESDKANNGKSQKLTFSPPQSMSAYVLERAMRSYSSIATADELIKVIRQSQKFNAQGQSSIYKAISEGWDYSQKGIFVKAEDASFLKSLPNFQNTYLQKVLKSWNVVEEEKLDANAKLITIRAIREEMKYDLTKFTVKAGETVSIEFVNPDAMQHNLVIVKPGAMEKVGLAADKMMTDEKAMEKNYVPALTEVLQATPLINPDTLYRLTFKAPSKPGDYPFVCTFPGHWRLMNGIMTVE
ncbi:putative membrane-bound dehydrogenase domain-containing protein [Spirosomataceae bacterium TFI 002]|nr:putative membrane-bound dehydrogenase domain-containing protein [Spirosomataceae bacterium TFI 002]